MERETLTFGSWWDQKKRKNSNFQKKMTQHQSSLVMLLKSCSIIVHFTQQPNSCLKFWNFIWHFHRMQCKPLFKHCHST